MRFEYRYIKLVDDFAGQKAVEAELNRLGADGWDLATGVLPGGWGIMKRAAATLAELRKVA